MLAQRLERDGSGQRGLDTDVVAQLCGDGLKTHLPYQLITRLRHRDHQLRASIEVEAVDKTTIYGGLRKRNGLI